MSKRKREQKKQKEREVSRRNLIVGSVLGAAVIGTGIAVLNRGESIADYFEKVQQFGDTPRKFFQESDSLALYLPDYHQKDQQQQNIQHIEKAIDDFNLELLALEGFEGPVDADLVKRIQDARKDYEATEPILAEKFKQIAKLNTLPELKKVGIRTTLYYHNMLGMKRNPFFNSPANVYVLKFHDKIQSVGVDGAEMVKNNNTLLWGVTAHDGLLYCEFLREYNLQSDLLPVDDMEAVFNEYVESAKPFGETKEDLIPQRDALFTERTDPMIKRQLAAMKKYDASRSLLVMGAGHGDEIKEAYEKRKQTYAFVLDHNKVIEENSRTR